MNLNRSMVEKIRGYYSIITAMLISFQLYLCISVVILHIGNFTLTFSIFLINFIFLFITKKINKDKNKSLFLLKISVVIFVISVANVPLAMIKTSGLLVPKILYAMVNVCLIFISYLLLTNNSINKLFSTILEVDINSFDSENNKNVGDIEICKNIKTGKPVIIPREDRYLHTLILGPTGSGKTSQELLPMLNQDMVNLNMGITVIEPKSDLAEKVYALAKLNNRKCIYFNPIAPDCPYFNPLYGEEDEVVENMATTFNMLNADSKQYFKDMNEQLVRNSLKVLKRLYGNKATLIDLSRLIQNSGGTGREIVLEFTKIPADSEEIAKENTDLASWFLNDYLNERSKTYENTSGIRSQITKITSNNYLRRVLNPPNGENDIDFDKHLAEGGVLAITTAQGALRDLGKYLGYFIILQFQSAVFRRPGNEDTRTDHSLYIDEFQAYSNPGFADMLTQGRSYRVASHLATQNRALIGMGSGMDGKSFIELVSTNARNIIIFPGGNASDADYYSKQFGEVERTKVEKGISRKKFNPLYGFDRLGYPSETLRETTKKEAVFSPTDIMYRPFGEITYCIVQNKTLQVPDAGKVTFLSKEVSRSINEVVDDYNKERFGNFDEQRLKDYKKIEEGYEDVEINFEDPIEPEIEDYVMGSNSGKRDEDSLKEEFTDIESDMGLYDKFESYENDISKNNEDEEKNSVNMFEEVNSFNEDYEDNTEDDDGIIPIFRDEDDFLI